MNYANNVHAKLEGTLRGHISAKRLSKTVLSIKGKSNDYVFLENLPIELGIPLISPVRKLLRNDSVPIMAGC